jgi:hypothetical protein
MQAGTTKKGLLALILCAGCSLTTRPENQSGRLIKLDYQKAALAAILDDLGRKTGVTVVSEVTNLVPAITLRSNCTLSTREYVQAVATVLELNGVGLKATNPHVLRAFDVPLKVPPPSYDGRSDWLDDDSQVGFESLEINPAIRGLVRRLWYEQRR